MLGGLEGGEGARLIETVTAHGANAATRTAGAAHFAPLFGLVFLAAAVLLTASLLAVMFIEERPLRGPATQVKNAE